MKTLPQESLRAGEMSENMVEKKECWIVVKKER